MIERQKCWLRILNWNLINKQLNSFTVIEDSPKKSTVKWEDLESRNDNDLSMLERLPHYCKLHKSIKLFAKKMPDFISTKFENAMLGRSSRKSSLKECSSKR